MADLYQVPTFRLNEAVKRNAKRFPADFMFQLTQGEAGALTSQTAMSKKGRGGRRYLPYGFTEHGVAMLSSVLTSDRAVEMNILIIRAFVRLREYLATHKDLARKLEDVERIQRTIAHTLNRFTTTSSNYWNLLPAVLSAASALQRQTSQAIKLTVGGRQRITVLHLFIVNRTYENTSTPLFATFPAMCQDLPSSGRDDW